MPESQGRTSASQRRALAEFLRARRAGLSPADLGLAEGGPRRAAGLRREEVAVVAGVSVTWYTWLEQARPINPSEDVLRALARTLRLGPDETAHLLALAGPTPRAPAPAEPSPALQDLVDGQHPAPAILTDRRWDLIAWNHAAEALWRYSTVPADEPNVAVLTFHPVIRARLVNWSAHARRVVAEVRADSAGLTDDPRFALVLDRLRAHPEVDRWWSAAEVRSRVGASKVFDHPQAGLLRLEEVVLRPAGAPDLQLTVLVPVRGSDTAQRIGTLL
ncbi:helix-turn-helix transcriptional regulator [Solwaraspora sp. WMMD791]|uniref:helix-turn-helix transcriptional regulator n=1 Tax=Solwaraspora sp. WMMD791 TaxID=3016086 RepID=UPI00249BEEA2|nr:helix-turn-helix transcriptional regulator [Solwaraspora sp. WMMD791]WFE28217.1 helix-turn-helix transcriptional regulator [Solwaraspora sp. WMMD791]